jgi:hypothetical protein
LTIPGVVYGLRSNSSAKSPAIAHEIKKVVSIFFLVPLYEDVCEGIHMGR